MSLELLTGAHLQMLLHWEDRNSMAHSLESRLPFLDYRLVEFAVGLPDEFKIQAGATKAVMREGMKGLVPARVLQRRDKMAFATPEALWATQRDAHGFDQRLKEAVACCKGIIATDAPAHFQRIIAGDEPYDSAVWRIICFGAW